MKQHKRITEVALERERDSIVSLARKNNGVSATVDYVYAKQLEKEAKEMVAIPEPPITSMGEVTQPYGAVLPARFWIQNTLPNGNMVTEEASISRTDLLLQKNLDISALAIDAADTIKADNSLEKMLAHQMALNHELTMRMGNAAMGELQKIQQPTTYSDMPNGDATELQRLTNSMARLMGVYQQGLLTMQRLRTGGNQTVTVQHVNVQSGGQAVIGNVQAGGGDKQLRGGKSKNG